MSEPSPSAESNNATPIRLVSESQCTALLESLPLAQAHWARAQNFGGERHRLLLLPDGEGGVAGALWGLGKLERLEELSPWEGAALRERLPAGRYRLQGQFEPHAATQLALGWRLGAYRYDALRSFAPRPMQSLIDPAEADTRYAQAAAESITLARDLINTPANLLGPEELEAACRSLTLATGGQISVTSGGTLVREYPLVAAVGAASARGPRLIDCRWHRPGAARVVLVGKGVCFDSGGLDLKPSAAMLLMKKDMGGAACALALARLLLSLGAPVDLRVLIPAVENSVGGEAFRPGDVWRSRKGLSVEIGNTDAEGRLILADALADADADQPDLLIDLATLTGAARTALGPDLPALFSTDEDLAQQLLAHGRAQADPLWALPLWSGYEEELASRTGDLNNVSTSAYAGAIIAALFLRRFVTATPRWLHLDLFAWNHKERPGRPLGGEAQGIRALYHLIRSLYG